MILIHEYAALKKAASDTDEFNEDIEMKAFENIASSVSHRTAKFISNSLEYGAWTKASVDRWQSLRQQVLKQPTVINDLQLNEVSEIWRSIYLKLPKPNNFYYYKRESDTDVEVFFSEKKGAYRLDEESLRLSELMKVKLFHDLFLEKEWATCLSESEHMLTPPMFNDIYKGALGEVCGQCVFEKIIKIPLYELSINEFEVFDFKTDNNVYIDFKFWNKNFSKDADQELDKIRVKMQKIKAEKVLIINILSSDNQNFLPQTQTDGAIIEIPCLFTNGVIESTAIQCILEELNK
jgi:hypothetical protein